MKPKDDPTIARIRATRHRISQQFDRDPQKLVAHYIALQEEYRRHLSTQSVAEVVAVKAAKPVGTIREEPATHTVKDTDLLALFQSED
jgi:hypothetical protein